MSESDAELAHGMYVVHDGPRQAPPLVLVGVPSADRVVLCPGQGLGPGEQVGGERDDLQPDLVLGVVVEGSVAHPGVFQGADALFDHAARLLAAGHAPARVAAVCGYADQSHLHREARVFTGLTPTAVAAAPWLAIDDVAWPASSPGRQAVRTSG